MRSQNIMQVVNTRGPCSIYVRELGLEDLIDKSRQIILA
jgi:hypothetical protein